MFKMSRDFEDVLYLFSCGALGIEATINHSLNIQEIYNISCKQGIWGVVFIALKQLYGQNKIEIDKQILELWDNSFLSVAVKQLRKQNIINNVLCELKKNNIKAFVLKGDIVAQYYKEPLSRISSDTDIYVGRQQLEKAEKIFENCGFNVSARSPMEHHTVCNHPVGGSVDLHLTFHDDCFEEKFFKGYTEITETGLNYNINDYKFLTLGATDNAIFLFLHLVKHFLSCGTGIRQIMDFLLFWKNNSQYINHSKFKQMLDDLGFSNIYIASVHIGLKYLQFTGADVETFEIVPNDFFANWLLLDIEQGGVFGKLEQRKLTFYYLFGDVEMGESINKKIPQYLKLYMNTFKYSYLSKKYVYVKKHKSLLPIAYINRIYDLILSVFRITVTIKKASIDNSEYNNITNRMQIINKICKK